MFQEGVYYWQYLQLNYLHSNCYISPTLLHCILVISKERTIMDNNLKGFIESSTIHGVPYISKTKKFTKVFWILVVTLGFTFAGYLIYQSFHTWAGSPVKTTIETLPITEITFPKVTVCPPKHTYTDLNLDILRTENMSLDL